MQYISGCGVSQTDTLNAAKPPVAPPDGDFSNASILYSIADRKYDVIAMIQDAGASAPPTILERTRYTAYGVARHEPFGDVDGDGATKLGTSAVNIAYDPSPSPAVGFVGSV